jgi:hypothetical protein
VANVQEGSQGYCDPLMVVRGRGLPSLLKEVKLCVMPHLQMYQPPHVLNKCSFVEARTLESHT